MTYPYGGSPAIFSGVEGNKKADQAVKEAAIGERVQTAKWISLTHVKR